MNRLDLPYYENDFCARLAFIEPFGTDWDTVSTDQLVELKNYLLSEWPCFQRAIIDDIRQGFSAASCVTSIFLTLKKYSRWFYECRELVKDALLHL